MSEKGRLAAIFWVAIFILCAASTSWGIAYDYRPTHYTFGIRGGFIYGSNLSIASRAQGFDGLYEFDTEIGLSAGIIFELPISQKYVAGLAIDLHDIQVEEIRKKFLDASLGLKRVIAFPQSNFSLRAGGALGFGYLGPDFGGFHFQHTTFLTVKATIEGVFPISLRYAWLIDLSILRVPTGGNAEVRANFGPTVIGRVGILM